MKKGIAMIIPLIIILGILLLGEYFVVGVYARKEYTLSRFFSEVKYISESDKIETYVRSFQDAVALSLIQSCYDLSFRTNRWQVYVAGTYQNTIENEINIKNSIANNAIDDAKSYLNEYINFARNPTNGAEELALADTASIKNPVVSWDETTATLKFDNKITFRTNDNAFTREFYPIASINTKMSRIQNKYAGIFINIVNTNINSISIAQSNCNINGINSAVDGQLDTIKNNFKNDLSNPSANGIEVSGFKRTANPTDIVWTGTCCKFNVELAINMTDIFPKYVVYTGAGVSEESLGFRFFIVTGNLCSGGGSTTSTTFTSTTSTPTTSTSTSTSTTTTIGSTIACSGSSSHYCSTTYKSVSSIDSITIASTANCGDTISVTVDWTGRHNGNDNHWGFFLESISNSYLYFVGSCKSYVADSGTNSYRMSCSVTIPTTSGITNGNYYLWVTGEDYNGYCYPGEVGLDAQNYKTITLNNCYVTSTTTTSTTSTTLASTSTSTTSPLTTIGTICNICPPDPSCVLTCDTAPTHRSEIPIGNSEYFSFNIPSTAIASIVMTPDSTADYDLYTKWSKLTCPTLTDTDCGTGFGGSGQEEGCGAQLSAGTYYIMVNHFDGPSGYDLTLNCLTSTTTTTIRSCSRDVDCCQMAGGPCTTGARCSSGTCICGVGSPCPV